MGTISLDTILVTPMHRIDNDLGDLLTAMSCKDDGYAGFGEAYFSWINVGAIKGWKRHLRMTMNLIVPVGRVHFVFYAPTNNGVQEFRVEEIGVESYSRITVPPGIWFAFRGLHSPQSLLVNLASIPHDPSEVEQMALADINYDWSSK